MKHRYKSGRTNIPILLIVLTIAIVGIYIVFNSVLYSNKPINKPTNSRNLVNPVTTAASKPYNLPP